MNGRHEQAAVCRRRFLKGTICGVAAVPFALSEASADIKSPSVTLRIAHLCDPQFGFITGNPALKHRAKEYYAKNYKPDLARCEMALAAIDEIKPDLLLFGGDMTQWAEDLEVEWPRLLNGVKTPWMVTPGNHDMGNNVTRGNLERFRKVFGCDRDARDVKGWRIIAGNSQFWHPTQLKNEQAEYKVWVDEELEKAKDYGGKVVLATHIPPFEFSVEEKGFYGNHPSAGRKELLEKYVASGARIMLTAHHHRLAVRGYKSLTIFGTEATCDNFDLRPQGFRIFEIAADFSCAWRFYCV